MEEPISAPVQEWGTKSNCRQKKKLSLLLRREEIHSGNNHYLDQFKLSPFLEQKCQKKLPCSFEGPHCGMFLVLLTKLKMIPLDMRCTSRDTNAAPTERNWRSTSDKTGAVQAKIRSQPLQNASQKRHRLSHTARWRLRSVIWTHSTGVRFISLLSATLPISLAENHSGASGCSISHEESQA